MREIEFLDYISRPLRVEQTLQLYRSNNIIIERVELYHEFIESLLTLVHSTYLGSDIINTDDVIRSHFNWCWDKVIFNFAKERIIFKSTQSTNSPLYEYLWNFTYEAFYEEEGKLSLNKLMIFWNQIMSYSAVKTKSDIDSMIEVYKLFEKTLI